MYKATIGMEVHAELNTKSKVFCRCKNSPEDEPNTNICPVCLAHPGVLPVLNKEAIKSVLKIGVAVGGKLADFTEFDRKNYFYPDLPKGYQISQYKYPLVSGGEIAGVKLTRIHLEEDTAKSTHKDGDTLVDFNRSGAPLMELVTEPVIHKAQDAAFFAKELQLLLRTLKVSDANMERGQMRVEANISVSKDDKLGTKVEVKNLNSFKSVEKAIEYEIKRQIEILENGEEVKQETRGWDEVKQVTFSQRAKEEAADYRYFPEPDLTKLKISEIPEFSIEKLKDELPELPWDKRERLQKQYKLSADYASILVSNELLGDFFEDVANLATTEKQIKYLANLIINDLSNSIEKEHFKSEIIASLLVISDAVVAGKISSNRGVELADSVLSFKLDKPGVEKFIEQNSQITDENTLKSVVDEILTEFPDTVAEYKAGKEKALMFLVGKGMQKTSGKADPSILQKLLKQSLS